MMILGYQAGYVRALRIFRILARNSDSVETGRSTESRPSGGHTRTDL